MWERLAISCAKTVRPVFIPHCSADAGSRHSAHYGCFQFKSFLGRIPDILRMAKDLSDSAKYFTGHQCIPTMNYKRPVVIISEGIIHIIQRRMSPFLNLCVGNLRRYLREVGMGEAKNKNTILTHHWQPRKPVITLDSFQNSARH